MTDAKIKAAPAKGHGLIDRITESHFHAITSGDPVNMIPAVVMLRVFGATVGVATANTGGQRFVSYELARCEPVLDPAQSAELQFMIEALYKARTSPTSQAQFPISFPGQQDEEKRKALMERLEDWSKEQGMTAVELEQKWREHWGIGPGQENSWGDRGVPADYRASAVAWLSQVAFEWGALGRDEEQQELPPTVLSDEAGIGDDSLATPDDDPLAAEAEAPAATEE